METPSTTRTNGNIVHNADADCLYLKFKSSIFCIIYVEREREGGGGGGGEKISLHFLAKIFGQVRVVVAFSKLASLRDINTRA